MNRPTEFILALLAAIVLAPVILLLILLVYLDVGRPVFFTQFRPGLGGKPFRMIKFRTMRIAYDAASEPLPDVARLTAFGRFLRSTSLDELPELWNVLKGEMSLVGPRPLLMEYLPLYSAEQRRRHLVRPGITGWSQINGRNAIEWQAKLALDTWYVDNRSFTLDVKILWLTLLSIIRRHGISAEGEATMPRFTGERR